MKPPMLSIQHVAERLRLSDDKVRRLIATGQLQASKIGRWRVEESDLEAFIAAQRPAATSPIQRSDLPPLEHNPFA